MKHRDFLFKHVVSNMCCQRTNIRAAILEFGVHCYVAQSHVVFRFVLLR